MKRPVRAAGMLLLLCGCSGAGSAGPSLPTVTLTLSPTRVALGESATLSWSSTGAATCSASNAWSGPQATSGSLSVKPESIGQTKFSLACTGTGGTTSQVAILAVPMPVFPSSYENAKNIVLSDPNIRSASSFGIPNATFWSPGFAFADFFQEGVYSAFVSMNRTPTGRYTSFAAMRPECSLTRRREC